MKKLSLKLLITFLAGAFLAFPVLAEKKDGTVKEKAKKEHKHEDGHKMDHKGHKDHKHEDTSATAQKIGKDKILIKVKGMVCAFCAQGIKKNFNAKKEVKDTKVDLDKMEVLVNLNKGKTLSEDVIKEVVTGAGFKFVRLVE